MLLSMLRMAVDCDVIPPAIADKVTELRQTGPRLVRRV